MRWKQRGKQEVIQEAKLTQKTKKKLTLKVKQEQNKTDKNTKT